MMQSEMQQSFGSTHQVIERIELKSMMRLNKTDRTSDLAQWRSISSIQSISSISSKYMNANGLKRKFDADQYVEKSGTAWKSIDCHHSAAGSATSDS
jgi:hypothetical protein